eukprot:gene57813-biopygen40355
MAWRESPGPTTAQPTTAQPTTQEHCYDETGDGWCVAGSHELLPNGVTFVQGPNVDNGAYVHAGCGDWHGTFADAKVRCNADPSCITLHDVDNDGNSWRACSGAMVAGGRAG